MWYLIRLNNKKDEEEAEKVLKESGLPFFPISSLLSEYQPQPAVAFLMNQYAGDSYLISADEKPAIFASFLQSNKTFFQKVRCKCGTTGHVKLTQDEMDQLILILQIPESYKVICVNHLPSNELLKKLDIPFGPLQGLKGRYLDTKTPSGKRFYLNVMNLFLIEVRIPIKDIKRNKAKKQVELSYLLDERVPHWFLLSCTKKSHVEAILGETANPWKGAEKTNPIRTDLPLSGSGQVIQTTRYLYQAIFHHSTKDNTMREVNLMPNRYFFRTNRYDLETFRGTDFNSHIYIMRNKDGSPIQIPDSQMNLFYRFLQERSEATEVLYDDYKEGDVVQVSMGIEKGNEIEGTIQIATKNHYIIVSENGFKINVRKKKKK